MVHSDSIWGGHYYSFINPSGLQWYQFNDEHVSVCNSERAINDQLGGTGRGSAYMLVYIRRNQAAEVLKELSENDIPNELKNRFAKEKYALEKERLKEIDNAKKCNLKYFVGHDIIENIYQSNDNNNKNKKKKNKKKKKK